MVAYTSVSIIIALLVKNSTSLLIVTTLYLHRSIPVLVRFGNKSAWFDWVVGLVESGLSHFGSRSSSAVCVGVWVGRGRFIWVWSFLGNSFKSHWA